jgi:hypothetical protein
MNKYFSFRFIVHISYIGIKIFIKIIFFSIIISQKHKTSIFGFIINYKTKN